MIAAMILFSLLLFNLMTSFQFNCCNFTCQSYIFSKCNIVYVETESLWLSILVYGSIHCNHFWHHLLHIKMVKLTEMWKETVQSFMLNKENDSIYHLSCYIHFTNNNSTFFLNRIGFSEDQRQCSYSLQVSVGFSIFTLSLFRSRMWNICLSGLR